MNHEENIVVVPYDERIADQDILFRLWTFLQKDRHSCLIWTDGKPMTLNAFIRWFSPESGRLLFLPIYREPNTDPGLNSVMGFMWVDNIELGIKGFCHFVFRRAYFGENRPLIAIRKGLEFAFSPPLDFQVIVCRGNSDNRLSLALQKRLGVQFVGEIPYWYKHEDGFHSATFGYLTREQFRGG